MREVKNSHVGILKKSMLVLLIFLMTFGVVSCGNAKEDGADKEHGKILNHRLCHLCICLFTTCYL